MDTTTAARKRFRIRVCNASNTAVVFDTTMPADEAEREYESLDPQTIAHRVAADFCDSGTVHVIDLETNVRAQVGRR